MQLQNEPRNKAKSVRRFAKLSVKSKKTDAVRAEPIRLIAHWKIHGRNRNSRMFTYFNPLVCMDSALREMEKRSCLVNGIEHRLISARQLNKCFGFQGNDVKTVNRAVDEMQILKRNTDLNALYDVDFIVNKRIKGMKFLTVETARRIIDYVYDNQEEWE